MPNYSFTSCLGQIWWLEILNIDLSDQNKTSCQTTKTPNWPQAHLYTELRPHLWLLKVEVSQPDGNSYCGNATTVRTWKAHVPGSRQIPRVRGLIVYVTSAEPKIRRSWACLLVEIVRLERESNDSVCRCTDESRYGSVPQNLIQINESFTYRISFDWFHAIMSLKTPRTYRIIRLSVIIISRLDSITSHRVPTSRFGACRCSSLMLWMWLSRQWICQLSCISCFTGRIMATQVSRIPRFPKSVGHSRLTVYCILLSASV